jgi:uncharacterized protein (TIGR03086 family)
VTAYCDPEPAVLRMIDLLGRVPDELLYGPTPCAGFALRDLLDHVGRVAINYAAAGPRTGSVAPGSLPDETDVLGADWRTRIPQDLEVLAGVWHDPAAWSGTGVRADGARMPRDLAGLIVIDEMVVHGWDIARAIGRSYACTEEEAQSILEFFERFAEPGRELERASFFGPIVRVAEGASSMDRALGLSGRDPAWSPYGRRDRAANGSAGSARPTVLAEEPDTPGT